MSRELRLLLIHKPITKKFPLSDVKMVLWASVYYCAYVLRKIVKHDCSRRTGDCSTRESPYCKLVSVFNNTQTDLPWPGDSSIIWIQLPHLLYLLTLLASREIIKVFARLNDSTCACTPMYSKPFWRKHASATESLSLPLSQGRKGGVLWVGWVWRSAIFPNNVFFSRSWDSAGSPGVGYTSDQQLPSQSIIQMIIIRLLIYYQ